MRHTTLGGTGISVSDHGLGAMMFGTGNNDQDDCVRIIHRALDAGINLIDTADAYDQGGSEEIVGKALAGARREDVVLATKGHMQMGDDPTHQGNSRRWLTRALDDSLRRLGTDHVDLYQVHRPDPRTDIDETLAALTDFVRAGKIRAFGTSTFPAEQLVEAQWAADLRGHLRPRTEQAPYSILARGVERAVLPTTRKYGVGVLVWGPLSAGWLSGRIRSAADIDLSQGRTAIEAHKFDPARPGNARKLDAVSELAALAEEAGLPLPHLATAFVRAHPAVSSVLIGPRTMEHLESLLTGVDVTLPADVLDRIDAIVPPGTDLNNDDFYYTPPALEDPTLRRR